MVSTKSKQMTTGKSFEYALLAQFVEKLKSKTHVQVIENSSYKIAKGCFENVSKTEQSEYSLYASFAVNFLMDIEPRLSNDVGKKDILQLEIQSDHLGKSGDVRDVLAIRLLQKWEIGVSAKNNHHAVKHSRLSADIDFGEKWLGTKVSKEYFKTVSPIFDNLKKIKKESKSTKKWSELGNYHSSVYVPVLTAFIRELTDLCKKDPRAASNLVTYLVGNKDFYKVVKGKDSLEIHAFNMQGTLNLPFNDILPKCKTPRVPMPTKVVGIEFKKGSDTTAIVTMDKDWVLSFRIHNASSRVEPSLKFDISLLNSPKKLFKNTLNIKQN
jgi:hypothetical protein